jgi:hypothetical protein
MIGILLAGSFILFIVGAAVWHLALEELVFLNVDLALLAWAWMVWRHGIVGYASSGGTATTREAPLPRGVLVPPLVLVAAVFLLAGSGTGVGAVFYGPAHAGVATWEFLEGSWNILTSTALILGAVGALGYGLFWGDDDALMAGGCLGGLIALGAAINYLIYLVARDAWRQEWNDYWEPVRVVAGLFD